MKRLIPIVMTLLGAGAVTAQAATIIQLPPSASPTAPVVHLMPGATTTLRYRPTGCTTAECTAQTVVTVPYPKAATPGMNAMPPATQTVSPGSVPLTGPTSTVTASGVMMARMILAPIVPVRFHVISVKRLSGRMPRMVAGTAYYYALTYQTCSGLGCWAWGSTQTSYWRWFNYYQAWHSGGITCVPNSGAYPVRINGCLWTGWNPAYAHTGEYTNSKDLFSTGIYLPWGSAFLSSYSFDVQVWPDGTISFNQVP